MSALYSVIREIRTARGMPWFSRPWDLNLDAWRSADRTPDLFNDAITVATVDERGREIVFVCPATTEPGIETFTTPKNPKGTPRVCKGWHPKAWALGTRSEGRPALIQIPGLTKPIKVQRDADRNRTFDENAPVSEGYFSILLHEPYRDGLARVGPASEGCVVPYARIDARQVFGLVARQEKAGLGRFVSLGMHDEADDSRIARVLEAARDRWPGAEAPPLP